MNSGPHSHDVGMSLEGATVERAGYMALRNVTFDVGAVP